MYTIFKTVKTPTKLAPGVMGPTMFREQLRTIFGLKLTRAEVAGLVSVFDLHRDGMIDAKEFAFRCNSSGVRWGRCVTSARKRGRTHRQ